MHMRTCPYGCASFHNDQQIKIQIQNQNQIQIQINIQIQKEVVNGTR